MTILKRFFCQATNPTYSKGQNLWKKYLRYKKSYISLQFDDVAEAVVEETKHSYLNENKMVFEGAPGAGFLTKYLLRSGAQKVRVFENVEERHENINILKNEYPQQLEIIDRQILDFAPRSYLSLNLRKGDMIDICFEGIPESNRSSDNKIVFYACLSNTFSREFISFMSYTFCNQATLYYAGMIEFYLFLPYNQIELKIGKASQKSVTSYMLFNSLYDYEFLRIKKSKSPLIQTMEVDGECFSLIDPICFVKNNNKSVNVKFQYALIRVKPKPFMFQKDEEYLKSFYLFVKQSCVKRTNLVIRYLENHFPGCTYDLIGSGISYFDTFDNLSADDIVKVFDIVYKLPQYKTSIFQP